MTTDPVPGTLEDVADRLRREDADLLSRAADSEFGKLLFSESQGIRLALKIVEDAIRVRGRVIVEDEAPPADSLEFLRLVPVEEGEEIAAARREVERLRRMLTTAAGDIEHELSPLVGWLRLGPACTTDEERRATISRLTRAIQVLSPEWTVPEEIRPTESAASSVALAKARREGAVQALRAVASELQQGSTHRSAHTGGPMASNEWATLAIAATIDGRADAIEAGEGM